MNHAKLFKTQRTYTYFLGLAGVILLIWVLAYLEETSFLIAVAIPLITTPVFQSFHFKKFYFRYDKEKICWNYPNKDEEQRIDLTDSHYTLTKNWKGIVFKGEDQTFEISLDQIWKRDQNQLLKELQEFYA